MSLADAGVMVEDGRMPGTRMISDLPHFGSRIISAPLL
jgi:hypothetical protein